MAGVVIRLQHLPLSASAADIRTFFSGLDIPNGGVRIIGGPEGDCFLIFSNSKDAREALRKDGFWLKDQQITLFPSSDAEMQNVMAIAKGEMTLNKSAAVTSSETPAGRSHAVVDDRDKHQLNRAMDNDNYNQHNSKPYHDHYDQPDLSQRRQQRPPVMENVTNGRQRNHQQQPQQHRLKSNYEQPDSWSAAKSAQLGNRDRLPYDGRSHRQVPRDRSHEYREPAGRGDVSWQRDGDTFGSYNQESIGRQSMLAHQQPGQQAWPFDGRQESSSHGRRSPTFRGQGQRFGVRRDGRGENPNFELEAHSAPSHPLSGRWQNREDSEPLRRGSERRQSGRSGEAEVRGGGRGYKQEAFHPQARVPRRSDEQHDDYSQPDYRQREEGRFSNGRVYPLHSQSYSGDEPTDHRASYDRDRQRLVRDDQHFRERSPLPAHNDSDMRASSSVHALPTKSPSVGLLPTPAELPAPADQADVRMNQRDLPLLSQLRDQTRANWTQPARLADKPAFTAIPDDHHNKSPPQGHTQRSRPIPLMGINPMARLDHMGRPAYQDRTYPMGEPDIMGGPNHTAGRNLVDGHINTGAGHLVPTVNQPIPVNDPCLVIGNLPKVLRFKQLRGLFHTHDIAAQNIVIQSPASSDTSQAFVLLDDVSNTVTALNELQGMKVGGLVIDIRPCTMSDYRQALTREKFPPRNDSRPSRQNPDAMRNEDRFSNKAEINSHALTDVGFRNTRRHSDDLHSPPQGRRQSRSVERNQTNRDRRSPSPHSRTSRRAHRHDTSSASPRRSSSPRSRSPRNRGARGNRRAAGSAALDESHERSSLKSEQQQPRQQENKGHSCAVITGLPPRTTFSDLDQLLHGISYDKASLYVEMNVHKECTGTAYVALSTLGDLQALLVSQRDLHGHTIHTSAITPTQLAEHVKEHKAQLANDPTKPGEFILHLVGLPYEATPRVVQEFLYPAQIKTSDVVIVKKTDGTGRCNGNAFAKVYSIEHRDEALKHDRGYIGKRYVCVKMVSAVYMKDFVSRHDDKAMEVNRMIQDDPDLERTVHLINLRYDIKPEEVESLFSNYKPEPGSVKFLKSNGMPSGRATVRLESAEQVRLAVAELANKKLGGRNVVLSPATGTAASM